MSGFVLQYTSTYYPLIFKAKSLHKGSQITSLVATFHATNGKLSREHIKDRAYGLATPLLYVFFKINSALQCNSNL